MRNLSDIAAHHAALQRRRTSGGKAVTGEALQLRVCATAYIAAHHAALQRRRTSGGKAVTGGAFYLKVRNLSNIAASPVNSTIFTHLTLRLRRLM